MTTLPSCLICDGVALSRDAQSPADVAFFECPECHRRYALQPGKALTFRWGHPISQALYPVMFAEAPQDREDGAIAADLPALQGEARLRHIAEIEHELDRPTQTVRDILDCIADEAALRNYLRRYCAVAMARS